MSCIMHVVVLCLLAMSCTGLAFQPLIICPEFVDEWGTLWCECRLPTIEVPPPHISWPGHSDSFMLEVANVSREDNGTEFTCLVQSATSNSTAVYTLQVAYGPSADDVHISGPKVFATNGTQTLTLTCDASDTNPRDLTFTWHGLVRCDGGNTNRNCSIRPQPPWDDGKRVMCRASNTAGQAVVTASVEFTLNLTYPPPSTPAISGFTTGEILREGDKLTCTVHGGKPLVSEVIFSCTDPYLEDQVDVADQSSVSSSVTIETENATGADTVCTCSAEWEKDKYNLTYGYNASVIIHIEYAATVTSFTINNMTDVVAVNESDHTTLTLECSALGLPRPVVHLSKHALATASREVKLSSGEASTSMVIQQATCEDLGTYVCTADNGFNDSKSAKVVVYCGPKLRSHGGDSNLPELTSDGLLFTLMAYPPPDSFSWLPTLPISHGQESDNTQVTPPQHDDNSQFTTSQEGDIDPLTTPQQSDNTPSTTSQEDDTTQSTTHEQTDTNQFTNSQEDNFTQFTTPQLEHGELVLQQRFGELSDMRGGELSDMNLSETFFIDCEQSAEEEYLVLCEVRAVNISEIEAGIYRVSISNGYGVFVYSFKVNGKKVGLTGDNRPGGANTLILIVACVCAALVFLTIIVLVIVYHRRKEQREYHPNSRKTEAKRESDETPELQNQSRFHNNQAYDTEAPGTSCAEGQVCNGNRVTENQDGCNLATQDEKSYASPDLNLHSVDAEAKTK